MTDDPIGVLRRWTEAGGSWRVVARRGAVVTVALCDCGGDAEMDRISSTDPALLEFLGDRTRSDD
ncbi:hypothetical protein [Nocardia stercoris]|uniref:Uncharacterized protein n=1 Tax=Nocardia stercoris TaxID=2483361 RepID=A0A3M2LF76_9NOCA|nr:hypothetical protein [Nocardia stercoris]RMI33328.1 hypothetical protein EBN03_09150 [Nocardia stercoris]